MSAAVATEMPEPATVVYFLFTDIEGSTRLWEQRTDAMRDALARHDVIAREAVRQHHGRLVKGTGDGIHAAFADVLDALHATLQIQRALADPAATAGVPLALRCGLHAATEQARDDDFYGPEVNRAARIANAAHGGQMLLSQAVAEALAQRLPEAVALRELGAVRLRDLSRPERLWQVLAPPLRQQFPALRSLEATPNNLAQQLNRFIGRAAVLPAVRTLLQRHRLVTLFGTGGIGKSRLAMQLGAELMDDFPDGVWFVELAPLADGSRVAQAVASVLGVREAPGQPLIDALQRFVAARRLLLVLDNCEHVLAASAELAKALLQAGGGLRLLATSREVLRVDGEASYAMPTLSVPPPLGAQAARPEQLLQHEAVLLFTDRAAAANADFSLASGNAAAVAEICQRLDGIPLALELAAARVRALSVQAIASRLRDSFRLLTTHDATVAPRQRTLQLLIDWSHDLLGETERVLYRRLSVFAGGWTLPAVEQVCADEALPTAEVLDGLTLLVEKSLVVMTPDWGADGARYRLLETMRQHAAARLLAAEGAADALRLRHAAWCRALAEALFPQVCAPGPGAALARLDQEQANLLAALAWCARDPGPALARAAAEAGLRIGFALRPYWLMRGRPSLGVETALAVLAQPGAQPRDALRAQGLLNAGQLSSFMGRYADVQTYLGESLAIAHEIGDQLGATAALQPLGMAALGLGDAAAARRHFEAAVAAARALHSAKQLASGLNALAQLERLEGRLEAAQALYTEAMVLARQLGDLQYIGSLLLNLAMVALGRGRSDGVANGLREVLRIADDTGSRPAALSALDVCAGLAAQRGEAARAARFFGLAEAQAVAAGLQRDAADAAFLMPLIAQARQALGEHGFAAAEQAGRASTLEAMAAEAEAWLADPQPAAASTPLPAA